MRSSKYLFVVLPVLCTFQTALGQSPATNAAKPAEQTNLSAPDIARQVQSAEPESRQVGPVAPVVSHAQSQGAASVPITLDLAARLNAIDAAIAKLSDKSSKTDFMTPIISAVASLLGVIIGGAITSNSQRKQAAYQWKLKQLSELYGPLRALLMKSNAMYRLMNEVLERVEPKKFRLRTGNPGDDFDDKVFEIFLRGEWTRFRTIMHLNEVYGRGYGVEDYFDDIVKMGEGIVTVIEKNAGLARVDQPKLTTAFGEYLAHYSVLQHLHAEMQSKYSGDADSAQGIRPMPIVESAVFPKEIQGLVDAGFERLHSELNK